MKMVRTLGEQGKVDERSCGGTRSSFFWCNEPVAKADPDIDTHPQLLLPLVGKYAR
jgi:hypothetical protein